MEKTEFRVPMGERSHKIQMNGQELNVKDSTLFQYYFRKSFLASTLDQLSSLRSHWYDLPQNTFLAHTCFERWNFLGDPCIRQTAV
jgi:hypothetical protein